MLLTEQPPTRRRSWWPALGLLGLLALIGVVWLGGPAFLADPTPAPAPTPTSWPIPYRFDSPAYGVSTHLWWDRWAARGDETRPGQWQLIQDAGFGWAKQKLAWRDVEGILPGHYDWWAADQLVEEAEAAGVALIFRIDRPPVWALPQGMTSDNGPPVDPADLQSFCYAVASRYRGRVAGYQVWNEPNLAREWGGFPPDPAAYVALLRACYVGVKAADPQALVISAGLAPTGTTLPDAIPDTEYLTAMYAAGAAPYFDLLGLNAPGYKAPPEIAPEIAADPAQGYGGQRFFCFRHVEDMRAIMEQHGDGHKQVALLEFGWTTDQNPDHHDYVWFAVTPEEQADYLVRAFAYAREHWSPWIGPMFVWNMPDPSWTPDNEEFWWAIVDPFHWDEGLPRPAYEALRQMEKP